MKRKILTLAFLASTVLGVMAQPLKTRVVDEGGTGLFKAIAVQEQSMPDFVVYRPKDLLHAHARCGALPLLLFGNGGCSDTSVGYERMLSEVALHGYIVVAIGEMRDSLNERPIGQTESSELMSGLELMLQMNKEVSRLVLIYPALCIPDNWNSRYPKAGRYPRHHPSVERADGAPLL